VRRRNLLCAGLNGAHGLALAVQIELMDLTTEDNQYHG